MIHHPRVLQFGPKGDVSVRRSAAATALVQAKKVILPSQVTVGKIPLETFIIDTYKGLRGPEGPLPSCHLYASPLAHVVVDPCTCTIKLTQDTTTLILDIPNL